MPIIRRKLDANTVYPANLRYNPDTGTVQSNVNGTWKDNPEADPRTQTTLPARITSDPACDAAQSVSDALKTQISGVIAAIEGASTLFTIAGIILSVFTFGTFDIFIGLALTIGSGMVDAGAPALSTSLTDTVFNTFTCILFCNFNASGRLKSGGLDASIAGVNSQIGGLGAVVLNAMLALAGEGGINNLAAKGASTGDCSDCGCAEHCPDADNFYNGTVNSITDNGDGTITFNVTSNNIGSGATQYIGWGNRADAGSPCCTFKNIVDEVPLGAFGGAYQLCGSSTEATAGPDDGFCVHFFLFYHNLELETVFTADITFRSECP